MYVMYVLSAVCISAYFFCSKTDLIEKHSSVVRFCGLVLTSINSLRCQIYIPLST
uniref:Uncharacterized protein n=1 Tax=Arundo donax TaxID=35708 RepID=A0A0A9BMC9_ARUDO